MGESTKKDDIKSRRIKELLKEALYVIDYYAEEITYGSPAVEDPRDFTPDIEVCYQEEIDTWKEACKKVATGEMAKVPSHCASWGIGISVIKNPKLCNLRDRIKEALFT